MNSVAQMVIACAALAATSPVTVAQPDRVIPAQAAREDAALARRAVEMIHPGLDRYTPREAVDEAFDRLDRAVLFLPLRKTGIKVRIPAMRSVMGIAWANKSGGLDPDVLVRPTLADRVAGRDVVLLRAVELAGRADGPAKP